MSDSRKQLTTEEATAMIADGDYVHTFINGGPGVLLGADWDRKNVLNAIAKFKPELAGETATGMDHGLAFHDGTHWVFVATKPKQIVSK